eukprot:m.41484 g.41484  ORF g.41484 m.41484 type:complete len:464 (+) comp18828_c0_seq1:39-1430(+)
MVPTMLEQEHASHIKSVFLKYDTDRSGTMSVAELGPALDELGVDASDPHTVTSMMARVDLEPGSPGSLSLSEFSSMFAFGRLQNVFKEIDCDDSGSIDSIELKVALKKLGVTVAADDITKLLAKVDTDCSGSVSFDEFYQFFHKIPSASLDSIIARWSQLNVTHSASDLAPPIPPTDLPTWLFLLAGGTGGCISRTVTAPLERVKIVAQTRGLGVSVLQELSNTWKQGGIRKLFAGNGANLVRVFPYAGTVVLTYNTLLKYTPADNEFDAMEPIYRGGCAAVAGVVGQIATYPLDVVRAHLTLGDGKSKGVWQTLRTIHQRDGVKGLYRGLIPTCMACAPFLAIQMPTLDLIKMGASAYNVPVTTGILMAGGATAGAFAQTVVYPLDLLRRRMQVTGMPHTSASASVVSDSTWMALTRIVRMGDARSLFAGIVPTYLKVLPATAVAMTVTNSIVIRYKEREII